MLGDLIEEYLDLGRLLGRHPADFKSGERAELQARKTEVRDALNAYPGVPTRKGHSAVERLAAKESNEPSL